MPRTPSRRAIVDAAVKAHSPRRPSGGTSAPKGAARGPTTGLSGRRKAGPRNRLAPGRHRGGPGGGSGGVGAAGAAGAASPYTPPPWDSRFESTVSNARATAQRKARGLDRTERAVKQDYGLAPGFNDYQANPFSRAALLQDSFKRGNRSITASAGLQLYSGSTGNKLSSNRRAYGQQRHELESDYLRELREIGERRAEAAEEREEAIADATYDRNLAAEDADLDADALGPAPRSKPRPKAKRKPKPKNKPKRRKQRPRMGIGAGRPVRPRNRNRKGRR